MDGTLFNIEDYTDERVRRIMQGKTCRHCGNRKTCRQGHEGRNRVSICEAIRSKRTKSGFLRVRVNQPACILFTNKE